MNVLIEAKLSCKGSSEAVAVATTSHPFTLMKLHYFMRKKTVQLV